MSFIINTTDLLQVVEFYDHPDKKIFLKPGKRVRIDVIKTGLPYISMRDYTMLSDSCYLIVANSDILNSNVISLVNTTKEKHVVDLYYNNVLMYGIILRSRETVNNQGQYATRVGFRDLTKQDLYEIENFGRIAIIKKRCLRASVKINNKYVYPSSFMPVWMILDTQGTIKVVSHKKMDLTNIISGNSTYAVLKTTFDIAYLLMKQQNYKAPRVNLHDKTQVISM